jgi:hypothetical protein
MAKESCLLISVMTLFANCTQVPTFNWLILDIASIDNNRYTDSIKSTENQKISRNEVKKTRPAVIAAYQPIKTST